VLAAARWIGRGEIAGAPAAYGQSRTEVVIFSPAEELRKVEAVMMKNLQAMQAG
jgi:hypothetical protein